MKCPPLWIADKLNRDFIAVLKHSEIRERLVSQGFEVVANSRSDFSRYIKDEIAKWAKVIKQAGIRAN